MPSHGGGGFGGGHSGGGGFSGGHSGGGFSGGGFHGGHPGGFHGAPPPPMGGGFYRGPRRPYYGRGGGCGGVFVVLVIFVIIMIGGSFSFIGNQFRDFFHVNDFSYPSTQYNQVIDDNGITQSTHNRVKMDGSLLTPVNEYITDEQALLKDDVNVQNSLTYFYEKTGVQPYLYVTDRINGQTNPKSPAIEDFAYEEYVKLFGGDEGHLLIVFVSYTNYDYDFYTYYLPGNNTLKVMDEEAGQMLLDYLDYYSDSTTKDEMFIQAFRSTADRMMAQTALPDVSSALPSASSSAAIAEKSSGLFSVAGWIFIGIAVIAIVTVITIVIRNKREKEAEDEDDDYETYKRKMDGK